VGEDLEEALVRLEEKGEIAKVGYGPGKSKFCPETPSISTAGEQGDWGQTDRALAEKGKQETLANRVALSNLPAQGQNSKPRVLTDFTPTPSIETTRRRMGARGGNKKISEEGPAKLNLWR